MDSYPVPRPTHLYPSQPTGPSQSITLPTRNRGQGTSICEDRTIQTRERWEDETVIKDTTRALSTRPDTGKRLQQKNQKKGVNNDQSRFQEVLKETMALYKWNCWCKSPIQRFLSKCFLLLSLWFRSFPEECDDFYKNLQFSGYLFDDLFLRPFLVVPRNPPEPPPVSLVVHLPVLVLDLGLLDSKGKTFVSSYYWTG